MKAVMGISTSVAIAVLISLGGVAVAEGPPSIPPDHYKCYKVKGEFQRLPVGLQDQFVNSDAVVVKPAFICNPVQKADQHGTFPVTNSALHYTLYLIKEKKPELPDVTVDNQFGRQPLDVITPQYLAVPSCKNGPCNFDWGQFCPGVVC